MLIPLAWLAGTLIPLFFLNRWLSRHIQGVGLLVTGRPNVAIILYFLIMLPGIIAHELSHWLMAKLLGLKTGKVSLGPSKASAGKIRLGSVRVAQADPLRESLVGLAPLLVGAGLILLIGALFFDLRTLVQAFVLRDARHFLALLAGSVRVPDFWIWLYLIFAISNAMMPSESDRRAWLPLGLFLVAVAIVLFLVGWVPQVPASAVDSVGGGIEYLTTAFLLTLATDLVFMLIIFLLEQGISLLTGRRIAY